MRASSRRYERPLLRERRLQPHKRESCVFAASQSNSLSKGGMRQKERPRFSTVSLVPEPSGSNKYVQVPSRELDDVSVMRWLGTNSVNTSNPSTGNPVILAAQV